MTVQTILSEVGLDPTRFPTIKHFTSWLGLSPGGRITGGKVKSARTRSVINRANRCFSDGRSNCGLSAILVWERFIVVFVLLNGAPKAITATADKIARIFYHLWTRGGSYVDPGVDYYEQRYRERMVNNLHKKAQLLGFELIPQPAREVVS